MLSTLLSNSLEEVFDDNFVQGRKSFFCLRTITKISSDFPRWALGRFAKTAFRVTRCRFYGIKTFFERLYFPNVLWFGSTIFQNVCHRFLGEIAKTSFIVSSGVCSAKFLQKFLYFNFCLTFSTNSFVFFGKKVRMLKLQFTGQKKNIWRSFYLKMSIIKLFQCFDQKVIGTSAEIFGQCWQISNLTVVEELSDHNFINWG